MPIIIANLSIAYYATVSPQETGEISTRQFNTQNHILLCQNLKLFPLLHWVSQFSLLSIYRPVIHKLKLSPLLSFHVNRIGCQCFAPHVIVVLKHQNWTASSRTMTRFCTE